MRSVFASIAIAAVFGSAALIAQDDSADFRARLFSYNEVPTLSTPATGEFRLTINDASTEATYQLQYSGLSAPVTQAHIHLGAPAIAGGVMIWLCGTATNPGPAGTPPCPQSGTVSGTIRAENVVGPDAQGIAPGQFAEALRAIRLGFTYANVHTNLFPTGEIRGQIEDDSRPHLRGAGRAR